MSKEAGMVEVVQLQNAKEIEREWRKEVGSVNVRFWISDHEYLDCIVGKGALRVRGIDMDSGLGVISVEPVCSNCVEIGLKS